MTYLNRNNKTIDFLSIINEVSIMQYKIFDGILRIDEGVINIHGSQTFNESMLYALTSDYKIYVDFTDTVPEEMDCETPQVTVGMSYHFSRSKMYYIAVSSSCFVYMDIDGRWHTSIKQKSLGHELAGHCVPEIKNKNNNAIKIENQISEELGWSTRPEDSEHVLF